MNLKQNKFFKFLEVIIFIYNFIRDLNFREHLKNNELQNKYPIRKIFNNRYNIPSSIDYIIPYILFSTRISRDGDIYRRVEIKIHFQNVIERQFEWFVPLLNNTQQLKGLTIRIDGMPVTYNLSYTNSRGGRRTALIKAHAPQFSAGEVKLLIIDYYISNYIEKVSTKRILYSKWKYSFRYKAIRPTLKIEMRIYLPSDYRLVKFQTSQNIEHIELKYENELIVLWEKEGLRPQNEVDGIIEYDRHHPAKIPLITVIASVTITAIVGIVASLTLLDIVYLIMIIGICSTIIILLTLLYIKRIRY